MSWHFCGGWKPPEKSMDFSGGIKTDGNSRRENWMLKSRRK
jgi:hypothetical protein